MEKWILAAFNQGKKKQVSFFVENENAHSARIRDAKVFSNKEEALKFKKENPWTEHYTPYVITI